MHLRRILDSALLLAAAAALAACNNDNINNSSIQIARFQMVANATDTLLLDAATGDLWKLDEVGGDELAHWVRYAEAPGDARPIDLDRILHPEHPGESEAAEEPHDDQPDQGEPQDGDQQDN